MEIFNIGPLELLLILALALILLGPEDMINKSRAAARWVVRLVRSPMWAEMMNTSRELRDLPNRIVREAGIQEDLAQIQREGRQISQEIQQDIQQVPAEKQDQPVSPEPADLPEKLVSDDDKP
jgi:sec-independent protein translocase protein TatB